MSAELLSWRRRPSSIVRPSVNSRFWETATWIQTKLYGKLYRNFEIFVNTAPHGAGNFKTLLLLQFSSDLSQTLWGHWLPWWNPTGCYFSWQSAKFETFVTLWKFNMGVKGKIIKCAISWKRLAVERIRRKFGTHGPMYCIYRLLFMSNSVSSVSSNSVHCAHFRCSDFQKAICPQFLSNFNQTVWEAW